MQCSDLSSTISGILILQYVLEMRNTKFLGLDGGIASKIPSSSSSVSDNTQLSMRVAVVG